MKKCLLTLFTLVFGCVFFTCALAETQVKYSGGKRIVVPCKEKTCGEPPVKR